MSNTGRRPERTCVACRRARDKAALLRIVRTPAGIRADHEQRIPGRGAYVCAERACVQAAGRRGAAALRRALRTADLRDVQAALDELRIDRPAPSQSHTNLPSGRAVAGAEEKTDAPQGGQERSA